MVLPQHYTAALRSESKIQHSTHGDSIFVAAKCSIMLTAVEANPMSCEILRGFCLSMYIDEMLR